MEAHEAPSEEINQYRLGRFVRKDISSAKHEAFAPYLMAMFYAANCRYAMNQPTYMLRVPQRITDEVNQHIQELNSHIVQKNDVGAVVHFPIVRQCVHAAQWYAVCGQKIDAVESTRARHSCCCVSAYTRRIRKLVVTKRPPDLLG